MFEYNEAITIDTKDGQRHWVLVVGYNHEMLVVESHGQQMNFARHQIKKLYRGWRVDSE